MAKFGWHTVAAAAYSAARYNFILNVEEARDAKELPYKDSKGIATIGVGFNIQNEGQNTPQSLTFNKIFGTLSWDTGNEKTYSDRLKTELAKTWTSNDALQSALNKIMLDRYNDASVTTPNKRQTFSFANETEIQDVFVALSSNYETSVDGKLTIDPPPSSERVVLFSFAWNNADLIGPGLNAAIIEGNRAEAWYEIRYNSNGDASGGIAKRRYYESETFGLYNPGALDDAEARQIFQMATKYQAKIEAYDVKYGAQVAAANTDYATTVKTLDQSLSSAKNLMVSAYAKGYTIDKVWVDYVPKGETSETNNLDFSTGTASKLRNLILGGGGNDVIKGGSNHDVLHGEEGNDTLQGGDGNDVLIGGLGNDALNGGARRDVADYSAVTGAGLSVIMNGTNGTAAVGAAMGAVTGGTEADTLTSIEVIKGTAQADYFRGGGGKVVFEGGAGDDVYDVRYGRITILEKQGAAGKDALAVDPSINPETHERRETPNGTEIVPKDGKPGTSVTVPNGIEGVKPGGPTAATIPLSAFPLADDEPPEEAQGPFQQAPNATSPLVLDLDGDGIELVQSGKAGSVYFDLNNDGFAERTGWVTGGDGLLAYDRNNNGKIDNKSELFGDTDMYVDGFANLKSLDSNKDGKITSADTDFSKLRVWVDSEVNGRTDAGELKTLADYKITQINLNAVVTNYKIADHAITDESSFIINGVSRKIVDAWFTHDKSNTRWIGAETTIASDVLFLPNLTGLGIVRNLDVAMTKDSTLKSMVVALTKVSADSIASGSFDFSSAVRAIMHRWAGVDAIAPDSRGSAVDARDLAAIEKFMGEKFLDGVINPWNGAGAAIEESFSMLLNKYAGALLAQIPAGSVFFGTGYYDFHADEIVSDIDKFMLIKTPFSMVGFNGTFYTDKKELIVGTNSDDRLLGGAGDDVYIVSAGGDVIEEEISAGTDTVKFTTLKSTDVYSWTEGYYYYIQSKLNPVDRVMLYTNYTNGNMLDINMRIEKISFADGVTWSLTSGIKVNDSDDGHTMYGTAGVDTFYGNGGDDIIYAGTGNDVLDGGAGNDYLYGDDGNDTLNGGAGDDRLIGGLGDDVYTFGTGFGGEQEDVVEEDIGAGTDTVKFTTLKSTDVYSWTEGYGYYIQSKLNPLDRVMLYTNYSNGNMLDINTRIEKISFADGVTWSLASGIKVNDSDDGHSMYGTAGVDTFYGNGGDDYIQSGTGNDVLDGGAGNDYLYGDDGNDTLNGGAGDDTLDGGMGDDIYQYFTGSDNDIIRDAGGSNDVLSINTPSVRFERDGMRLNIYAGAGKISLEQQFYDESYGSDGDYEIEKLVLSNGTTYNLRGSLTYTGTSGADSVNGTILADTLDGLAGNDTLQAGAGNDRLIGGAGDDYLSGEMGNDVYEFSSGFGHDTIYDYGSGSDTIKLSSSFTTENISLVADGSYDARLTSGTNSILISGQANAEQAIEYLQFSDGFKANMLTYKKWVWGASTAQTTNGTTSSDTILARAGDDVINGNSGNDSVHGGSGNDKISGGTGEDTLHGGIGNDVLYGNAGADILFGGAGSDVFKFTLDSDDGKIDTVKDFKIAENDKIDIHDLLVGYNAATSAITSFLEITTSGANSIVKIDRDGAGATYGWKQIATLEAVTGLSDEQSLLTSGHIVV